FLLALEVFHREGLEEGQDLFGPSFVNWELLTAKHLGQMTLQGYSPYHNGQVFVTSHFAFIKELEQALQAVDPSIALPYWEYTEDAVLY
ncbi:unnamed protein product, partial [Discosporangium mesarthrocarpum]